ncbi:MAG: helix-turn-helix domain-containing protein [Deltaproteobacteria bacterium]|nr:helix-turn-helix domain-containing protein [Deltaproteobacteria bacterium]
MSRMKKVTILQQRFYPIPDAAKFLGVSEQFLYNGTSRKSKKPLQIPFKRIGGKILFDLRDLENL